MKYQEQFEFDDDQKLEIQVGMNKNLDVSFYARPEFMAIQMRQIRMGLEEGLDVAVYSKPEYDWFQMEEIRKGIEQKVNYELYAKPSIDYKRMRQIRKGLQQGIDLSLFVRLDSGILEELRKAIVAKVTIVDYIKEGYQVEQLPQIREALEKNLDIRPYINKEFRGASIREIALGLERGIPVSVYASMDYSWQQMREIRLGMEARLDVSVYSNNMFSWQQMRELRLGLEEGLDVSSYCSFVYIASDMERRRKQLQLERAEKIVNEEVNPTANDKIAVFISNDEMEACVEVRCDAAESIGVQEIKESLKVHGICYGILEDELERIVREKKYRRTIVIAKGKQPQPGEDGRYEFYFNTSPNKLPKILEDGSADYRDVNWFEMVEKGQKVAYYFGAGVGVPGCTVTGRTLNAKKGKEKSMLAGRGFELMPDGRTYISSMQGKIDLIGDNRLEITRVIVLDEVSLSTGNINFDGSIYIRGNVGSGTIVQATENIVVHGFVEAATIRCGGEICLKGVNGGGSGLIEAKQNVMGQFFEGVRVVAGGDISAYYALNCEMYAEGMIVFHGNKGLLLGGYTRAGRGIQACNVGNKVGLSTVLNVGIDDKFMSRMHQFDYMMENVQKELSILNNSYNDFKKKYPAEVRNAMELFLKIENAIYTKEQQMKELNQAKEDLENEMKEMENARVRISGTLYEGTEVTVDNVKWEAFSVKDVTIRCTRQRIVVESN